MATFVCEKCGRAVKAASVPHRCPGCDRPAAEVFQAKTPAVGGLSAQAVADHFDVGADADGSEGAAKTPAEGSASPAEASSAAKLKKRRKRKVRNKRPGTDLITTGDIGAGHAGAGSHPRQVDVGGVEAGSEIDDASTEAAGGSGDSPEGERKVEAPIRGGGLSAVTTLELDEKDLQLADEPPPLPAKPRRRRITEPGDYRVVDAPRPPKPAWSSRNESAAEQPSPRVRRVRALTSQTETLRGARRSRRQRQLAIMLWIVAGALVAFLSYHLMRPTGDQQSAGDAPLIVDAAPTPDAASADVIGEGIVAEDAPVDSADARVDSRPDGPARKRARSRRRPMAQTTRPRAKASSPAPAVSVAEGRAAAKQAYARGLKLLLTGKSNAAIVQFNAALGLWRGFAPAFRGLGLAYERLGRKAFARAAYRRYLGRSPGAVDAAQIRARIARLGQ